MSVLLSTSLGDLVIDLHTTLVPKSTSNFLKLCRINYYQDACFHNLQRGFTITCGDMAVEARGSVIEVEEQVKKEARRKMEERAASATSDAPAAASTSTPRISYSRGGDSISGLLYGPQARYLSSEATAKLTHSRRGTVGMLSSGAAPDGTGGRHTSVFYITLSDEIEYLNGRHTIIGQITEGLDEFISKLNTILIDDNDKTNQPTQNIKLRQTIVLDDPFPDPSGLAALIPSIPPLPIIHSFDYELLLTEEALEVERKSTMTQEEIEQEERARKSHGSAIVLSMIGDLPDMEVKPPENVLFVCKLNRITRSEDLEIMFSSCGTVVGCEVIKDWKTGQSLQYAFVEYEEKSDAERAYLKLNNALVDDRRIKVDFSQSVSKEWIKFKKQKQMEAMEKKRKAQQATMVALPPRPTPPTQQASIAATSSAAAPSSSSHPSTQASSSHRRRSHSRSPHRSSHRSSSSRSRHHDKRSRSREREKDRDRDRERSDRDRHSSSSHHRDSHRDRSREKDTREHREHSRSDRDRDRSKERQRSSHHSSHSKSRHESSSRHSRSRSPPHRSSHRRDSSRERAH